MNERDHLERCFAGLLLGTAVGDALGLPAEGLSPERIRRRWKGDWRMRLTFGRGMVSDDTEHAFFVGQSLLESPTDARRFQSRLARRLRWWFLALPAGVGLATARACLKLWVGFSAERSGVFSAGNGPAMRSAILGGFFADDTERRRDYVRASTRLTHTDPRAETAALAVAEAAAGIVRQESEAEEFLARLPACGTGEEWLGLCGRLREALARKDPVPDFATSLGLQRGVTGYAFHTVPVALYAWLRHPGDFRRALTAALDCGGDTDTVGAIVGALAGAEAGVEGIPSDWLDGLCEWPRTPGTFRLLAARLARTKEEGQPQPGVRYCWIGVPLRNMFFLAIILAHGLRRTLPPY
ncbi:MAG: ADP-ribosylglycohydrolase family protein [Verrucomicrobiales bacterium]|nr:ADP-ribosylglycohydrolase family protein [Verrucomicrobiales bacterium]